MAVVRQRWQRLEATVAKQNNIHRRMQRTSPGDDGRIDANLVNFNGMAIGMHRFIEN